VSSYLPVSLGNRGFFLYESPLTSFWFIVIGCLRRASFGLLYRPSWYLLFFFFPPAMDPLQVEFFFFPTLCASRASQKNIRDLLNTPPSFFPKFTPRNAVLQLPHPGPVFLLFFPFSSFFLLLFYDVALARMQFFVDSNSLNDKAAFFSDLYCPFSSIQVIPSSFDRRRGHPPRVLKRRSFHFSSIFSPLNLHGILLEIFLLIASPSSHVFRLKISFPVVFFSCPRLVLHDSLVSLSDVSTITRWTPRPP